MVKISLRKEGTSDHRPLFLLMMMMMMMMMSPACVTNSEQAGMVELLSVVS